MTLAHADEGLWEGAKRMDCSCLEAAAHHEWAAVSAGAAPLDGRRLAARSGDLARCQRGETRYSKGSMSRHGMYATWPVDRVTSCAAVCDMLLPSSAALREFSIAPVLRLCPSHRSHDRHLDSHLVGRDMLAGQVIGTCQFK